jgi:hypothetical protein
MLASLSPIDDRYQNQNFLVKFYRWLRWKPYFGLYFLYWFLKYLLKYKGKIPSGLVWLFWCCAMARADMKMEHYYTLEELFNLT